MHVYSILKIAHSGRKSLKDGLTDWEGDREEGARREDGEG